MTAPATLDRALLHDLELGLDWVQATRMPERVKAALVAVVRAHMNRLRAPAVLAAISPGRWTLSQSGDVLSLDFTCGRQTQLEAAARFAARMLLPAGTCPQYIGHGWLGENLPEQIFARPVGPNALRNARNAFADHLERAGWAEVGAEIRRMVIGRNGELNAFMPSGRVLVAHPCVGRVQD